MKVRVLKTPKMGYGGGSLYGRREISPGEISALGMMGNQFVQGAMKTLGTVNYVSGVPKITPYEYRPLNKVHNWNPKNTQPKPVDRLAPYNDFFGQSTQANSTVNALKDLSGGESMLFRKDGGDIPYFQQGTDGSTDANQTKAPVDPQLLQAYRVIGAALGGGQDPNALVDQFVQEGGLSMEDATSVVRTVMEYLRPTNEEGIPMAQMGGTNNGIFAGQSMQPNIIEKPLMKHGGSTGNTYLTSQPAYTQKSVNYFGTSNAPARDNYTDNEEVTTSVKAVPREEATIEAEKGEYIISDKGLYKIEGKKHSQGGTPLAAKGGEFIFSAHKDMSLDHDLQKKAGLKVSSSKALAENTPAKVLERNVDVKEYNRLMVILQNPKSDAITKKTAQFMLDKMNIKIDLISKLQEAKKQPAPTEIQDQYIEQSEIQKDIDEQRQYAYGGDTGLPRYQKDGGVEYIKDENGNIVKVSRNKVSGLDPNSKLVSPYTKGNEVAERKARLEEWYNAMKAEGYTGNDPSKISNFDPNKQYEDIEKLQKWTAEQYPEYTKTLLLDIDKQGHSSNRVSDWVKSQGAKTLEELGDKFTPEIAAKLFPDKMFDWRLPIVFNKEQVEYTPWNKPEDKPKDVIEPKKIYTNTVSDIDIPNPYEQVKAMQFSQYANNVLSNKPYFTYTPAITQPITVAPRQSTQPLENQAGLSRRIASRVGSRLQDAGAMQDALAKENDAVNDAFFKIGQYNAEQEANNYNQNLLRGAAATNQFKQGQRQTYDQNNNVLDKMNFANAAYYNDLMTSKINNILAEDYKNKDVLTTMMPFIDTYDEENPNGTITKHIVAPINPRTGSLDPRWRGWNSRGVNDLVAQQSGEKQRLDALSRYSGYTPEQQNYILTGKFRN
jgi:polyhydroxyalkanoate synthesis regulator phasin